MLAQSDARVINSLPAVAVPTLVVVGANDKPFLAATDYMAAKIAGAQKVVIPDAGHSVNMDQPEPFNRAVVAFLDRLAGYGNGQRLAQLDGRRRTRRIRSRWWRGRRRSARAARP